MINFDDSEIVVFKHLADDIVKKLTPVCAKLKAKINKGINCYNAINARFLACDNIDSLEFYSNKMREFRK